MKVVLGSTPSGFCQRNVFIQSPGPSFYFLTSYLCNNSSTPALCGHDLKLCSLALLPTFFSILINAEDDFLLMKRHIRLNIYGMLPRQV